MKKKNDAQGVKIMFLGGVGEIGKNITAFEFNDEVIIVDCGLAFPNDNMPGIDLVIPSFQYLTSVKNKIKGVFLTHGHEDHIGSLPYFLKDFNVPVYGTKLTLALIGNKLVEHKVENPQLITVEPGNIIKMKHFSVEFIRVSHSIAGSCALGIVTPAGMILHTGDFKIDHTPVNNQYTDLNRIADIGSKGVTLLLSESTNVERPGTSMSESQVGISLNAIFNENIDRRIIIATFASNIHRIQQIIDLAERFNRKVCLSGRSMINVAESALKLGELKINPNNIVEVEKVNKVEDKRVVIITTGSQGEPMSALTRMAEDDFNKVKIGGNDTVIISATPIPGNERSVYNVINNLYRKGAKVIYESLAEVHASGHACAEELKLMHNLVKPKFFIPVHGEHRHLRKHAELAIKLGTPERNIFIADLGSCFELTRETLRQCDNVPASAVLVDGLGVGDVGEVVLKDRKILSEDGILVAVISLSKAAQTINSVEIITRGFIFGKESDSFIEECKKVAKEAMEDLDLRTSESSLIKSLVRKDLKGFIYKKMKRSPMIIPITLEM